LSDHLDVSQGDVPFPSFDAATTVTEPVPKRHCRSLKMAVDLANGLDLSEPLGAMLWSELGKCEARSGEVEAARRRVQFKEPVNAQVLLMMAKADIGVELAKALATVCQSRGWKPPLEFHDPQFQQALLRTGTRDQLIAWLRWNDPHGCYTDRGLSLEDRSTLTLDEARALLRIQIELGQSL
jgi:hypothetical protein